MSLASFSLNLSYFNINISIKRDELKRQKKLEEQLTREVALEKVTTHRELVQCEFSHFLY
ncbi:hypothetical protein Amet_4662 [Alkaliphilus metalliredigens QYMF]|uniref:Uncharacterized protein n=1 Tax=Alkaliphilus metalliredigens (strain QYMF) TaxID=293826 RepID=A6TX14_ALKMQ|nr:hypothetical protein [Alkaliphilus metalliredigens]ABR50732.1 hypothetical protein Amet_4662 [Alkaliphilus metalliredigens QYMF]